MMLLSHALVKQQRILQQLDVLSKMASFWGGDLNIIRLHNYDGSFVSYQLNGKRKYDIAKVAQGVSVVHLYGEHLKGVKTVNPYLAEQKKISRFLSLIDERIAVQTGSLRT